MRLLNNAALKLASLAIALLLWFVIAGEKTSEMGLSVPVELQNFPKDLELTGEPVNRVEVRVRATPGVIQQLAPGDVTAQIDLKGATEGERIIHLTEDAIRVPFGVRVVKITPAILTLHLESTLQKVVPIRPRVKGRPQAGYEVGEVSAQPPEVRIAGPRSRVERVTSAYTEPVSVQDARVPVVDDVSLGLEDPVLRIQGSPRVRVVVRVREVHEKRAFESLEVDVRGGQAAVRPARVRIVLEGPVSSLDRVTAPDVRAYVDVTHLDRAEKRPVAVELSPGQAGVSFHHAEPAEVTVRPARRSN